MLLNTERFPTDDVEVRKALQYATNQEEISQLVTFGVEIPNKGVLTPESWVYYAAGSRALFLRSRPGQVDP